MQHLPRIGESVLVPWGLTEVPAEVVDLVPPDHVLVEVKIADPGQVNAEPATVRLRREAVREGKHWRVLKSRKGPPAPGADATSSWWVDAERNGETARTEVRLSGTASAIGVDRLNQEAQEAIATQGRSAAEKFAFRYALPRVIVIGSNGVFEGTS
jgi:hypothetical protein